MKKFDPSCLLIVVGLLLAPGSAFADTWGPLKTEVTLAENGQFRVAVVPRLDESAAIARVERLDPQGEWRFLRQIRLINDIAPGSVLLTNDASFLVTFDNWLSAGYGDDVIAIYDRRGDLVRKLSLEQVLPPAYVHHLPRSVSSRWWGGEHALANDDQVVELRVVPPSENIRGNSPYAPVRIRLPGESGPGNSGYVPVSIRLQDGAVIPPSGPAWNHAINKATMMESRRLAAWADFRRLRASYLPTPLSWDTREWRHYIFELRDRIAAEEERMSGMVLAAPGVEPGFHDAYDISDWIRGYDEDRLYSSKSLIVASPTSDKLASLLVKSLGARTEGSMKEAHIVFVGTPTEGNEVTQAAKRTGARVSVVDKTAVFPPGDPLPESPPPLWLPPPEQF